MKADNKGPLVRCAVTSSVLELLSLGQSTPNFTQMLDKRLASLCIFRQGTTNVPLTGLELTDRSTCLLRLKIKASMPGLLFLTDFKNQKQLNVEKKVRTQRN